MVSYFLNTKKRMYHQTHPLHILFSLPGIFPHTVPGRAARETGSFRKPGCQLNSPLKKSMIPEKKPVIASMTLSLSQELISTPSSFSRS